VQELDDVRARFLSGQAAVSAAEAQIAATEAAVATARSQLLGSRSAITAVEASIERLQVDIEDGALKAPCDGRIQYRVAQPGEILAGGGKILNLVNLGDVYMTFFLPTAVAGKIELGSEVHLVLDAAPQFVVPARISFVADVAQFTPRLWKQPVSGKVDVPGQGPNRSRIAENQYNPGENGPAWHGVCPSGPKPCLAVPPAGQTARGTNDATMKNDQAISPVARLLGVSQHYGKTLALDAVDLELPAGCMVGVIGPDGVGKSTLLSLIAGSRRIQAGQVDVLGGSMADRNHRQAVCPQVAYMPQGLGRNLYPTLSVFENVDFFARLFGHDRQERARRIGELLQTTGLGPFAARPAGQLSGGMKQKLGLCCALIHDPELLILDEPTTGVDPLSRRQFWGLIDRIRSKQPGMSVLVATAYMEEAARFDWLVMMNGGRVLATGAPKHCWRRPGPRRWRRRSSPCCLSRSGTAINRSSSRPARPTRPEKLPSRPTT